MEPLAVCTAALGLAFCGALARGSGRHGDVSPDTPHPIWSGTLLVQAVAARPTGR